MERETVKSTNNRCICGNLTSKDYFVDAKLENVSVKIQLCGKCERDVERLIKQFVQSLS